MGGANATGSSLPARGVVQGTLVFSGLHSSAPGLQSLGVKPPQQAPAQVQAWRQSPEPRARPEVIPGGSGSQMQRSGPRHGAAQDAGRFQAALSGAGPAGDLESLSRGMKQLLRPVPGETLPSASPSAGDGARINITRTLRSRPQTQPVTWVKSQPPCTPAPFAGTQNANGSNSQKPGRGSQPPPQLCQELPFLCLFIPPAIKRQDGPCMHAGTHIHTHAHMPSVKPERPVAPTCSRRNGARGVCIICSNCNR